MTAILKDLSRPIKKESGGEEQLKMDKQIAE